MPRFGNLTKSGSVSFQPTYNAATNRMLTLPGFTPTYDANGNTTADGLDSYAWDAEGRPVSVDSMGLTYDALGRMVEQNRGGAYTQIVYSPNGGKLALMNGQAVVKAFVPLPAGGTAVYVGSTLSYFRHPDLLSSSRFASTPSRTMYYSGAYAPFGEAYAEAGTADRSFTGQNQDTVQGSTTGLYDFLFREYAQYGRWISPDPAGLAAVDMANPQSWNRYAYVQNSPTNLIDPLGLRDIRICVPLFGFAWSGGEGGFWYFTPVGRACGIHHMFTVAEWDDVRGGRDRNKPANSGEPEPDGNLRSSACSNIPSSGQTIPVSSNFGQVNFQFNGAGALIGLGIQLTGNEVVTPNVVIPANTFIGITLNSASTVSFGFSNPVKFSRGFVQQAFFQTATFSGGRFTEVRGAAAPFGIPLGWTTTPSSILQGLLNDERGALQLGQSLLDLANWVSGALTCSGLFGGG